MPFLRSWGYAPNRPITPNQEHRLNELVDQYHAVQTDNFVDELDITEAVLGESRPFSELTVEQANKVAAHLNVRIALHTHFKDHLPDPAPDFAHEVEWLNQDRRLLDRVIARAGWDTGEYFLSPHPLDNRR
ncbi:hypothetical protein [Sulfobacillus harzensis]|uniref:Uncharacterized protein n=1 Tax=Sulfobacillus harzensis TaxID=2729629 RepID=A0A7Y0L1W5_9FIRM|nr:hypothetical protein [Sulfobacillus harzensis]NMP21779.1 hypothetical protein [Sulfobacillus harzensis]